MTITTTFTLKKPGSDGLSIPHKVDYRYLDLGSRSDYKQNYDLVNGTYTYLAFDAASVADADFAVPSAVHCKLFTDTASPAAQYGHGTAQAAAAAGLTSPLPDPAASVALLRPINDAARLVQEAVHPEANIIFGAVIDDTLGDEVRVTVIAAGFDGGEPTVQQKDRRSSYVDPEGGST